MNELITRLRAATQNQRRTSMPVADVIPMLQQAADRIAELEARTPAVTAQPVKVDFVNYATPITYSNGTGSAPAAPVVAEGLRNALDRLRVVLQYATPSIDKIHEFGPDGELEKAWQIFYDEVMPELAAHPVAGSPAEAEPDRRRCKECNATRGGTHCWKCGTETFEPHPSCGDDPRLPPIERIRELAKEVGYAIGVHGSLQRDLDVIAAPWTNMAIGNHALLEHIAAGLATDNGPAHIISTERKPLGRYAATIQMDGWYKQLDISVCPNEIYERVPAPAEQSAPPVPRMDEVEMLREVIRTVRLYPDFDGETPFGKMMDEALEGRRPELLSTIDSLAAGEAPVPRAQGGITNDYTGIGKKPDRGVVYGLDDNGKQVLATQSASTAPGQAEHLLKIIGYTYVIAGAHDAPDHILDVLADPEEATDEQVEAMLPYVPAKTGTSDETRGDGDEKF